MKKRIISLFLMLALLVTSASATARWSYMQTMFYGLSMEDGAIAWDANADSYPVSAVKSTGVKVSLQMQIGGGWSTLETLTDKQSGYLADAGGDYTDWKVDHTYRVKAYGYVYGDNDQLIETVGPLYGYLNT